MQYLLNMSFDSRCQVATLLREKKHHPQFLWISIIIEFIVHNPVPSHDSLYFIRKLSLNVSALLRLDLIHVQTQRQPYTV